MQTKPRAIILTGQGINCEEETTFAFECAGADAQVVHVNDLIAGEASLDNFQILAIPGGFSYGDHTGGGKALANRLMNTLQDQLMGFIARDTLTIGICNGFQVLTNLGLVPATGGQYMTRQAALMPSTPVPRYVCRWVHVRVASDTTPFLRGIESLELPIAHGEGHFYAPDDVLDALEREHRVALTYCTPEGDAAGETLPHNPNGALRDIAGVCDPSGRVFGLMPHPERFLFFTNHPDFPKRKDALLREGKEIPREGAGRRVFENAVEYFG